MTRPTARWIPAQHMLSVSAPTNCLIHVETPLGIVNIRTGLLDQFDRRVDAVEFFANPQCGRELPIRVLGNRLVEMKKQKKVKKPNH